MSESSETRKDRTGQPGGILQTVVLTLAFLLFALGLGWSGTPALAPYLTLGSMLCLTLLTRSLSRTVAVVAACLLTSFLSMFAEPAGWILPAFFLQGATVVVLGAALLLRKPGHPLLILSLPAVAALVFLLTRSPVQAILPLTPLLPLVTIVYGFRAKTARQTALLQLCATILLSILLFGMLYVFLRHGTLRLDTISSATVFDTLRATVQENLERYLRMFFEQFAVQTGAELDLSVLPKACEALMQLVINRLPGFLILLALLAAYFLHSHLTVTLFKMKREDLLYPGLRQFRLSAVSALLLTFTLFLSLFAPVETMFTALCDNLLLALLPAYLLVGFQWHVIHFRVMRPIQRVLNLLFWIFFLFNMPQVVLYVLAFSGIAYTMHQILTDWLAKHRDDRPD